MPHPRLLHRENFVQKSQETGSYQPDNYLQFTKLGTRKGMDVIWAVDAM